jgi:hypothetical protein
MARLRAAESSGKMHDSCALFKASRPGRDGVEDKSRDELRVCYANKTSIVDDGGLA